MDAGPGPSTVLQSGCCPVNITTPLVLAELALRLAWPRSQTWLSLRRKALGPASQVDVPGRSQMIRVMETKWPSFVKRERKKEKKIAHFCGKVKPGSKPNNLSPSRKCQLPRAGPQPGTPMKWEAVPRPSATSPRASQRRGSPLLCS